MESFTAVKRRMLKNPEFRRAYEALEPEFALIRQIIEKRLKKKLTQTALAKKLGTKQSAIARLESGNYNPSLAFLEKVAEALDSRLVVSLPYQTLARSRSQKQRSRV